MIENTTYKELLIKLNSQNNSYDFIAFCITPWHLLGVRAFLNELQMTYKKRLKGIIVLIEHKKSGLLINEIDLQFTIDLKINIFSINKFDKLRKLNNIKKNSGNRRLFVLFPNTPFFKFATIIYRMQGVKPELVIIDEGASSYLSSFGWFKHLYLENGNSIEVIKSIRGRLLSFLAQFIYRFKIIDYRIFKQIDGKCIKNNNVIKYYQLFLSSIKHDINIPYDHYIIILTQPINDNLIRNNSNNIQLYLRICQFFQDYGYNILVKLHPRDTNREIYIKNGFELLEVRMSLEQLIPRLNNKPKIILGMSSTGLLTSKIFFDISAYSLINLFSSINKINIDYDQKMFIKNFSEIINIPIDFDSMKRGVIRIEDNIKY